MAQSHGSPSFVMPLEGPGSVARPFCCRAGAWWPTLAQQGHLATSWPRELELFGPAASEAAAKWPKVMAPLLL